MDEFIFVYMLILMLCIIGFILKWKQEETINHNFRYIQKELVSMGLDIIKLKYPDKKEI